MDTINLAGTWGFALDPQNIGVEEQWCTRVLPDSIGLPGSTDEGGYGEPTVEIDRLRLNRKRRYQGVAWYRKLVTIPSCWAGKRLFLFLERCLWETQVWVDEHPVGSENSLSTSHVFDLTHWLTPGTHAISIRVDNTAQVDLGAWSHAWSEEVQTIWNGIIGKVEIRVADAVYVHCVQIYPDVVNRKVVLAARIDNHTGERATGTLKFEAALPECDAIQTGSIVWESDQPSQMVRAELALGDSAKLWDEFDPNLYQLTTHLSANTGSLAFRSQRHDRFGLREFRADGTRFRLNDYYIFLRGTHDAGNFPLTGYPAMDKAHWLHIYSTAKSYGLNHFRFHSWCPPEAAFEAADEAGVILQAELPFFGIGATPIGQDVARDFFLGKELQRILDAYGNHPSFCMMGMGNELKGDYEVLDALVREGQQRDGRRLFTTVANNAAEPQVGIRPRAGEDFYVAHEARVDGIRHLRRCELIFNHQVPETMSDYGYTLDAIDIPTVSHEVGQWAIYPNYREIPKYTGVLAPRNLEWFRKSLEDSGMIQQADDFVRASGALALALYREEIERSLRTPNYGGFQLLDIHDYPGQGTSLVGWLDAFWDSKGLIAPDQFRRFCDSIVLLLRMPKRVYETQDGFTGIVAVSNYSRSRLENLTVVWTLKDSAGRTRIRGHIEGPTVEQGTVTNVGTIEFPFHDFESPERLKLELSIERTAISNAWDIWVFPQTMGTVIPTDIWTTAVWDEEVEQRLRNGGKVLFIATHAHRSEATMFTTPFWNTQLFPNQPKTMGLWCDPGHPALTKFPTDSHSDWQWWDVFLGAKVVDISTAPSRLAPIIQAIDHPLRNHPLGLLFECSVGKGRLLVSGLDFMANMDRRPAARQLLASILAYMHGNDFNPVTAWPLDAVREYLKTEGTDLRSLGANSI